MGVSGRDHRNDRRRLYRWNNWSGRRTQDSRTREGLLLGSAIGLGFTILIAIRTGASLIDLVIGPWGNPVEHYDTIVALSTIPVGASIGFLSALSIAPDKEPHATPAEAEPSRSHRIFD